jgi:hypothetical protein
MSDTELTREESEAVAIGDYKYGFHDEVTSVFATRRGLDESVVREISAHKSEPEWMLDFRLKSHKHFLSRPMPQWGADLSTIDFDNIYYYLKPVDEQAKSWDDLPDGMRETWDKLGIPEAEKKYLAGVGAQYESEVVYHSLQEDLAKQEPWLPRRTTELGCAREERDAALDVRVHLNHRLQVRPAWTSAIQLCRAPITRLRLGQVLVEMQKQAEVAPRLSRKRHPLDVPAYLRDVVSHARTGARKLGIGWPGTEHVEPRGCGRDQQRQEAECIGHRVITVRVDAVGDIDRDHRRRVRVDHERHR